MRRHNATSLRAGLFYALSGVLLLWGALGISSDVVSTLRFARLGDVRLSTQLVFALCGVVGVLTGGGRLWAGSASKVPTLSLSVNAVVAVLVVLVWASMGRRLEVLGLLTQSIRLATPIALGALAGILCERSGVVNIAIEGMMLSAACVGFTAALYAHSTWIGLLAAILCGGLVAALHAGLTVHWRVDQMISGTVMNMLAIGCTGFIRRMVLLHNTRVAPAVLPVWPLPLLADLPVLGPLFFRHQPLVYTMVWLVFAVHIFLFYTPWGLRTRAVGEHPRAADTLGVNVFTVRYANVIAGGMIAGCGGAWFSLETVGNFAELMTNGKGFIALAAMVFGKWNPFGALGGAVLFGFADALQIKLQITGVHVPYQLLGMTPYVVTMVVLAGVIGRATPPAASGIPYERGL
jgi:simple sugar transport system permease protein